MSTTLLQDIKRRQIIILCGWNTKQYDRIFSLLL